MALCLSVCLCTEAQARALGSSKGAATTQQSVKPAGEVSVVINEGFLNALLDAIMSQSAPLKFPLGQGGRGCASEIELVRASEGVRTQVRFASGRVGAVVAFRGSYQASLLGCVPFEGWADSVFNLSFDRERQAFVARVEVNNISLRNIPSLLSSTVTATVQDAINQRVNPVTILRAEQLSAGVPLAQGNNLRLRAKGIRPTVVGKELRLHIAYEIVSGN